MTVENGNGSSRSEFLKQAAGATIVVAGATAGAGALARPAAAAFGAKKGYDKYLELDGVNVGKLYDASGGDAQFSVVVADYDADGNPDKVLGPPTRSPFTIEVGAGMRKDMYDWIHASFTDSTVRRSGSIVVLDDTRDEVARRSFTNAQITGFTVPPLQNSPQVIQAMTVTFVADSVSDDPPSSTPMTVIKHKPFLTSGLRLGITVPDIRTRITSIDSFTWKRTQPAGSTAQLTDPSDLTLLFDPAAMPVWTQWYDNYALGGDSSDLRDATLTVYGPSQSIPLFTCTFHGLGIFQLTPPDATTKPKVKVSVKSWQWDLAKGTKA